MPWAFCDAKKPRLAFRRTKRWFCEDEGFGVLRVTTSLAAFFLERRPLSRGIVLPLPRSPLTVGIRFGITQCALSPELLTGESHKTLLPPCTIRRLSESGIFMVMPCSLHCVFEFSTR